MYATRSTMQTNVFNIIEVIIEIKFKGIVEA